MVIDKLLSSVVKLWLKSQVSKVDNLQFKITGSEQQILQGLIPEIFVSATNVIYQGIHFSELDLRGNNIKFNLTQVIKKKPLNLLEPIVINLKVLLQEVDLQNSLSSPLLTSGLTDLWTRFLLLNHLQLKPHQSIYQWEHLSLLESGLSFAGKYYQLNQDPVSIGITTQIELNNPHTLFLLPLETITIPELSLSSSDRLIVDLGTQVSLTDFSLTPKYLLLKGTITVFPE